MERIEDNIGNDKQPFFGSTEPERLYYIDFGDTNNADYNVLPYVEEIQD